MTIIPRNYRPDYDTSSSDMSTNVKLSDSDYFSSDWYKEQIKRLRHRLISAGVIINPAWHPNNPVGFEDAPVVVGEYKYPPTIKPRGQVSALPGLSVKSTIGRVVISPLKH